MDYPPEMQCFALLGLVKDDYSLRDLKVTSGAKMMVIGSTIDDVLTVQAPLAGSSVVEPEAVISGKYVRRRLVYNHRDISLHVY